MSKFIKIKNDTGSGEMVLRTRFILKVADREEGGANVVYGESVGESTLFKTASTAAEVLVAIEGKKEPCGIAFFSRAEYEQRYGAANGITVDWRQATPMGERIHPSAFSAAQDVSVAWHHIGERVKQESLSFNTKSTEELPDGAVVFQGLEHMIRTEPPAESQDCTCSSFAGENVDCPKHGAGTAWRDLHGA